MIAAEPMPLGVLSAGRRGRAAGAHVAGSSLSPDITVAGSNFPIGDRVLGDNFRVRMDICESIIKVNKIK